MTTHWNYRILAKRTSNDVEFGIYEVYYENGIPVSCTVNAISFCSYESDMTDPDDAIKWMLNSMMAAADKPILDYDNFPNIYVKHLRKKKLKEIKKLFNDKNI